jgi:2-phospho-L-lactate guanylyltransferase
VVARAGAGAKSRLAAVLDPGERSALACAMLADVVAAGAATPGLAGVVVVADTADARAAAQDAGARRVLADPGRGMNGAVAAALAALAEMGAAAALVLPGDVPLAASGDLAALLAALERPPAVAVATDAAGTGTNGLALRPLDVIRPAFGPGSAARHLVAGRRKGAATRRLLLAGLALDVDTPDQLARLRGRVSPASATARALARLAERPVAGPSAAR